jgi:hypothetical protein
MLRTLCLQFMSPCRPCSFFVPSLVAAAAVAAAAVLGSGSSIRHLQDALALSVVTTARIRQNYGKYYKMP